MSTRIKVGKVDVLVGGGLGGGGARVADPHGNYVLFQARRLDEAAACFGDSDAVQDSLTASLIAIYTIALAQKERTEKEIDKVSAQLNELERKPSLAATARAAREQIHVLLVEKEMAKETISLCKKTLESWVAIQSETLDGLAVRPR